MLRPLLFAFALLAPCALRGQTYNWNIPTSVPSAQSYYVGCGAGFGWADVTIYKNGYYFASGSNYAGANSTEYGAQTVSFLTSFYDHNYLTSGSNSRSVTITAPSTAPSVSLNNVPSSVSPGQSFTISATASDSDNDLASLGIRWNGNGLVGGPWSISGGSATSPGVTVTAPSSPGTMLLRGEVWDAANNGATSSWYSINVAAPTYALTVTNGSGSGSYTDGTYVSISANGAPSGYYFAYWAQYSGPGVITNSYASSTTFRMGAGAATIQPIYQPIPTYSLTVVNGAGGWSGLVQGEGRTITAQVPSGTTFTGWSKPAGDPGTIGDANASQTGFTMGAGNSTVTANYQDQSAPTKPGMPVASSVAPTSFVLNWSASTDNVGVVAYQIEQNGTSIGEVGAANKTFTGMTSGTSYTFRVRARDAANNWSAWSDASAAVVTPLPVSITTQPQGISVVAGQPATFSVVAAGTGPLTYQWQKDGVPISGATTASLTINPAMANSAGNYVVVVTNPFGSITSNVATLTVTQANLQLQVHRPQ